MGILPMPASRAGRPCHKPRSGEFILPGRRSAHWKLRPPPALRATTEGLLKRPLTRPSATLSPRRGQEFLRFFLEDRVKGDRHDHEGRASTQRDNRLLPGEKVAEGRMRGFAGRSGEFTSPGRRSPPRNSPHWGGAREKAASSRRTPRRCAQGHWPPVKGAAGGVNPPLRGRPGDSAASPLHAAPTGRNEMRVYNRRDSRVRI